MNVCCKPIDPIPESLARSLREYSSFTSPEFVALLGFEYGWGGYVIVQDKEKIVAALPAVIRGKKPLARFQALLDGLPAPMWIADDFVGQSESIRQQILKLIRKSGYLKAHLTDFENALNQSDSYFEQCNTTVLDLTSLPAEFPPDKTLRAEISKAARDGVTVTALNRLSQMPSFLTLVSATEARHGRKPKYSDRFWIKFIELCEQDPRFSILCVESNGKLASAHVYICDRDTAHNWQVYFDKSFSPLKPNQAITAYAIESFRTRGLKYLNLGATPPDATGVAGYKSKWGGSEYAYRIFEFRSWLGKVLL